MIATERLSNIDGSKAVGMANVVDGVAKAVLSVKMTDGTIFNSLNISSATDSNVGIWSGNLTNAMGTGYFYTVLAGGEPYITNWDAVTAGRIGASQIGIYSMDTYLSQRNDSIGHVAVLGDLA